MRIIPLAVIAILGASPIWADSVTVENCRVYVDNLVACDITNRSTVAIAAIGYGVTITEEGRSVPWVTPSRSTVAPSRIDGGIEPNETVNWPFYSGFLDKRAEHSKLTITVDILAAEDIDGNPITNGPTQP